MSFDDDDFGPDEYTSKKKVNKNYPKCYVDKKHDGDPICKQCALELYDALPKKKFKGPRNCWNCDENGFDGLGDDFVDIADEHSYFDEG